MRIESLHRKYRVQIDESDRKRLPEALQDVFLEGEWLVTVEPAAEDDAIRNHDAFLAGYSDEDDGLYDDLAATG